MDLEELETINLRDSSSAFSCRWSEDNHLSILSENEVHILQLKPIGNTLETTINFYRQTIKPRNQHLTSYFNQELPNLIYKEDRLNVYNMINDPVLTPDGNIVECIDVIPRSALCRWSPAGVVDGSRCALLFLNSVGNVDIQISQGQFWVVVVDLTALYLENISSTWDGNCKNYEMLKNRCYQLSTSCADWSPMYNTNQYSYVVLGQYSGDVLIWKIGNYKFSSFEYHPILQTAFPTTNNIRVTVVHWIKTSENSAIIITGSLNGVVRAIQIENLENPNVTTTYVLWSDEDDIRVDQITSEQIKHGSINYLITVVKQTNLVCFLISENGELLCNYPKRVGNLSITGLERVATCQYLICTMTSYMGLVNVRINENVIETIEIRKINHPINCMYLTTTGICCSGNKALWFITTNYCKLINHLIIREPLQVTICYDRSKLNDLKESLLNNPTKELGGQWDCLELFRLLTEKGYKFFDILENYDRVDLYHLKIYMWMSVFFETVLKRKKRITDINPSSEDLKTLVMIKYCIEKLDNHTIQKQSVRAMREYLIEARKLNVFNQYLGEKSMTDVDRILQETDNIKLVDAMECSFCEAVVYNGKCVNGHRDNVCVVSLVPFSALHYRVCPNCDSVVNPQLEDDRILCTFCDIPVVYPTYKYKEG